MTSRPCKLPVACSRNHLGICSCYDDSSDPAPIDSPPEAVSSEREQWRVLLTQMLSFCMDAGLDAVDTLHKASTRAIETLQPTRLKCDDEVMEAVQRMLERGKAYIDSEGYLTLVPPQPEATPLELMEISHPSK